MPKKLKQTSRSTNSSINNVSRIEIDFYLETHNKKKLIIHNKLDLEIKGNSLYFDTCVN